MHVSVDGCWAMSRFLSVLIALAKRRVCGSVAHRNASGDRRPSDALGGPNASRRTAVRDQVKIWGGDAPAEKFELAS